MTPDDTEDNRGANLSAPSDRVRIKEEPSPIPFNPLNYADNQFQRMTTPDGQDVCVGVQKGKYFIAFPDVQVPSSDDPSVNIALAIGLSKDAAFILTNLLLHVQGGIPKAGMDVRTSDFHLL